MFPSVVPTAADHRDSPMVASIPTNGILHSTAKRNGDNLHQGLTITEQGCCDALPLPPVRKFPMNSKPKKLYMAKTQKR